MKLLLRMVVLGTRVILVFNFEVNAFISALSHQWSDAAWNMVVAAVLCPVWDDLLKDNEPP